MVMGSWSASGHVRQKRRERLGRRRRREKRERRKKDPQPLGCNVFETRRSYRVWSTEKAKLTLLQARTRQLTPPVGYTCLLHTGVDKEATTSSHTTTVHALSKNKLHNLPQVLTNSTAEMQNVLSNGVCHLSLAGVHMRQRLRPCLWVGHGQINGVACFDISREHEGCQRGQIRPGPKIV